jgi:hypothetical protein
MSTIDEIVAAAARLASDEFLQLREELDRLEQQRWDGELAATTEEMKGRGVSDEDIDRLVLRRRRENRP